MKWWLMSVMSIIILVALLAAMTLQAKTNSLKSPLPSATPVVRTFAVVVSNNKIDQASIKVKKGETVTIDITSHDQNEADIKIEAFTQATTVESNNVTQLSFVADKAGTFPIIIEDIEVGEEMRETVGTLNVE